MDSNRKSDNLIHDYFNIDNKIHTVKESNIINYNNMYKSNNSLNSSKSSSFRKGVLKKNNNNNVSISQNIENSTNKEDYKLMEDSSRKDFSTISLKNKNKEKLVIYDVIEEIIQ